MPEAVHPVTLISPVHDERDRVLGLRLEWDSGAGPEQVAPWLQWLFVDQALAHTYPTFQFWVGQHGAAAVAAAGLPSGIAFQWADLPPPEPAAQVRGVSTSSAVLLKLLSQITSDAETRDIEDTLKRAPDLSVQLLRLVNSVSFSLKEPVTSFAQAINLLGRRQLQRWLQLLMFSGKAHPGYGRPLMARAAMRGALMEQVAKAQGLAGDAPDRAFMVGMFSLLDVLFGKPLADIVLPLQLGEAINQPLLHRTGELGTLLNLADAAEHHDMAVVQDSLQNLAFGARPWSECQWVALQWMLSIGHDE